MYKIIIFDLDDTLIDNTKNIQNGFKEVLKYRNEKYSEEKFEYFEKHDKSYWSKRARGEIKDPAELMGDIEKKVEWVRAMRFLTFFNDIDYNEAVKINDLYMEALKENVVEIEGARDTVKYLKEKGYKIAVATNGPTVAINSKLSKSGILEYTDVIFSADEIGKMKPHKIFFDGLLNKIGSQNKEEMLIVGDQLEKDVKGGIDNNIDSCWFNLYRAKKELENYNYKPTYVIESLVELKNIL